MFPCYTRLVVYFVCCVLIVVRVQGCSEPVGGVREVTLTQRTYDADLIVYGRVQSTTPDPDYGYWADNTSMVYYAFMQVKCTMKGSLESATVNITNAGSVPGLCETVDLPVNNKDVIVFLRKEGSGYYPTMSSAVIDATPENMNQIVKACDTKTNNRQTQNDLVCPEPVTECEKKEEPSYNMGNDQVPPQAPPSDNDNPAPPNSLTSEDDPNNPPSSDSADTPVAVVANSIDEENASKASSNTFFQGSMVLIVSMLIARFI